MLQQGGRIDRAGRIIGADQHQCAGAFIANRARSRVGQGLPVSMAGMVRIHALHLQPHLVVEVPWCGQDNIVAGLAKP